jgi:hypothetical protein
MKTVKKYQAGGEPLMGTQPPMKSNNGAIRKSNKGAVSEASKKFKNSMKEQSRPPYQLNPDSRPKKFMQKDGTTGVGKSITTKKGSMATMSKKPLTPKAAYGMAVKPGMMKKGGKMKSK